LNKFKEVKNELGRLFDDFFFYCGFFFSFYCWLLYWSSKIKMCFDAKKKDFVYDDVVRKYRCLKCGMYLKNKRSYKVASTLFDLVNFMRGKK
jgi:hypothetical protein